MPNFKSGEAKSFRVSKAGATRGMSSIGDAERANAPFLIDAVTSAAAGRKAHSLVSAKSTVCHPESIGLC